MPLLEHPKGVNSNRRYDRMYEKNMKNIAAYLKLHYNRASDRLIIKSRRKRKSASEDVQRRSTIFRA